MEGEAFLKAVTEDRGTSLVTDADGDADVAFSFGSPDTSIDYHAHMRVFLKKDQSGRLELSFHPGPLEYSQETPPYVDECARWLGGFFKSDRPRTHVHANYSFGKSFAPIIALPYPLTPSEKALAGALVTGLSLLLPNGGASKSVIIQSAGDETYIFLRRETEIDLKSFDLFAELRFLATEVNSFVRKQEASNETSPTAGSD